MFEYTTTRTRTPAFRGELAFCSNFYPEPVCFEDVTYPTAEHAYVAAKTLDQNQRARVRLCRTAAEAKQLGRRLSVRLDWGVIKVNVMRTVLRSKFSNPKLLSMLRATGSIELVETNRWHDTFWGCCTCNKHRGVGENNLGRLLMEIRDGLEPVREQRPNTGPSGPADHPTASVAVSLV